MEDILDNFIKKNSKRAMEWSNIIEEMLSDDDSYGYARSTLIGILDFIDANENITDGQIQAVENIKDEPSYRRYGR